MSKVHEKLAFQKISANPTNIVRDLFKQFYVWLTAEKTQSFN